MFKSLFSIRRKKKDKHPRIVVGANRTSFDSIGLTHSKKHGNRNNLKLKHNPNPSDSRQAYVDKRIVRDFKFRFSKAFKNYKLSDEVVEDLKKFLDRKKKK